MSVIPKTYPKTKTLGQIYTPPHIVCKILDELAYDSPSILGQTILDPACGDGRFLLEAAKRIIQFSPPAQVKSNLENLYGWDIDNWAIQNCLQNLNALIKDLSIEVNWNVYTLDSLLQSNQEQASFDFIIGNPPYIRIQHLEEIQRKYIQEHYHFCQSGSTDIYLAFFELCERLLSKEGICGLISPNTYFYTETARNMRNYFAKKESIRKIINFGQIQVFSNATTYSAITIFTKKSNPSFFYQQAKSIGKFGPSKKIAITELQNKKTWRLTTQEKPQIKGIRLGELSTIGVGLATLLDRGYVFSGIKEEKNGVLYLLSKLKGEVVPIEANSRILKPIIKGSTFKLGDTIRERILFPYELIEGRYQIISELDLKEEFPLAYAYLLSIKPYLDQRDKGKRQYPTWFAFGRHQSLDNGFGSKIIFSPMNKKPNFIFSKEEDTTIYSGYYLKLNENPSPQRYQKLLRQLNSKRMEEFISISSRDFRGGWKAYNKKVIEDFIISPQDL